MQIFVRRVGGDLSALEVSGQETVAALRERISTMDGMFSCWKCVFGSLRCVIRV